MERLNYLAPYFFLILVISITVSCKPELKSLADVKAYIENPKNKLTDSVERSRVKVALTWQPWQLLAAKRNKSGNVDEGGKTMKDYHYLVLSLSSGGQELLKALDYQLYGRMVPVLSFQMQEYISMVSASKADPVKPVDCFFDQTYGMSDSNKILVVFRKADIGDTDKLRVSLKEFGLGIGKLDFDLDMKGIKDLEQLDYRKLKL